MAVCTFFGHRQCPDIIKQHLRMVLLELIDRGVDLFYVGNQGQFDAMVRHVLRELSQQYPNIRYAVVLAYLPTGREQADDTMFPEGLETVHPRYAISRRNEWMLREADFVVAYVTHGWGGAAQYVKRAKGKVVINLGDDEFQNKNTSATGRRC